MGLPCLKPLPLCKPRDPQASDLWRLLDGHFETFREIYSEQFQAKYGFWQPVVDRSAAAFLKCGTFTKATPETTAWYQSLIPGSKLEIFEDASHLTMVEPDKYA